MRWHCHWGTQAPIVTMDEGGVWRRRGVGGVEEGRGVWAGMPGLEEVVGGASWFYILPLAQLSPVSGGGSMQQGACIAMATGIALAEEHGKRVGCGGWVVGAAVMAYRGRQASADCHRWHWENVRSLSAWGMSPMVSWPQTSGTHPVIGVTQTLDSGPSQHMQLFLCGVPSIICVLVHLIE